MVHRLPCHRVLIHECVETCAGGGLSGGCDTSGLEHPAMVLLIAMPVSFSIGTLSVEDPRSELSGQWVPANSLSATHGLFAANDYREFAKQKVSTIDGFTGKIDDRIISLINPVTLEPTQLLQMSRVLLQITWHTVSNAGYQPIAIDLDV